MLNRLHTRGPLTLTELSEYERVTAGSMSQTINRLADGGYVTRRRDDHDKRRVMIEATTAGNSIAAAARAHREDWMNTRLAAFTAEECATLARAASLLSRLADDN